MSPEPGAGDRYAYQLDGRDLASVIAEVPVRDGTDEPMVAQGPEVPVRIFNVDRQIAERVEKNADKEVGAEGRVQSEREAQPCDTQRKGMHSVDQVLPKRALIVLAPNHFFRKMVKVVLAQV